MRRGEWRLRVARWLAPDHALKPAQITAPASPEIIESQITETWAEVCEQFAWRLLVLTEHLRPALDGLEGREEDPDRLAQLYQLDHGITRMRRVARDLRVLAGRGGEETAGHTTSLLDVIRMAASAIEHYGRVSTGPVAELAVVAYAADDVASLLAALADNATRYSPGQVTISAHLLADGAVMLRVEDAGLGIEPGWLGALNDALAGPVPSPGVFNGRHTGFAVIHRLAGRHGMRVQLARRQPPGPALAGGVSGTIAMVVIPPPLLCEISAQRPAAGLPAGRRQAQDGFQTPGGFQGPGGVQGPGGFQSTGGFQAPDRLQAPDRVHTPDRAQAPVRSLHPVEPLPPAGPVAPPQPGPGVPAGPPAWPPPDRPPAQPGPEPAAPPQAAPAAAGAGNSLPRREPRSVRTPVRPGRAESAPAPAPAPGQGPDPAAEGFAFAADLQAFSAALGSAGPHGGGAAEDHTDDAEGHRP